MKITGKANRITVSANGKRAGVTLSGPTGWNEFAKHPEQIKLRCKRGVFPTEIAQAAKVTNNSDMREDYFEADTIILVPGDAMYEQALAAA